MSNFKDFNMDYERGVSDGYEQGRQAGYLDGFAEGIRQGREEGYADGFDAGYERSEFEPLQEHEAGYCLADPDIEEVIDSENYWTGTDDEAVFEDSEFDEVRDELGGEDE
jgi:hypothetical protein